MKENKTKMVPGTVVYYQGTLKIHTNRSPEQSEMWHIHRCKTCSVWSGNPHLDAMD